MTDETHGHLLLVFFAGACGKAGRKHSTTRDSHLNKGFNFMGNSDSIPPLGATPLPEQGWRFVVWAPTAKQLSIHIAGADDRVVPMQKSDSGYFETTIKTLQ